MACRRLRAGRVRASWGGGARMGTPSGTWRARDFYTSRSRRSRSGRLPFPRRIGRSPRTADRATPAEESGASRGQISPVRDEAGFLRGRCTGRKHRNECAHPRVRPVVSALPGPPMEAAVRAVAVPPPFRAVRFRATSPDPSPTVPPAACLPARFRCGIRTHVGQPATFAVRSAGYPL